MARSIALIPQGMKGRTAMFTFDLEASSKGVWFAFFGSKTTDEKDAQGNPVVEYFKPEEGAGRVEIGLLDYDTMQSIYRKTRTPVKDMALNPTSRKMERVDSFMQTPEQQREEIDLTWDAIIKNWEGMKDKNKKDIPCTFENKIKMMKIPMFARFVTKCLETLQTQLNESAAVQEKN